MEMNPFRPLIQHCTDFYGRIFSLKEPLNNFYLKLRLSKVNSYDLCSELTKQQSLKA